MKIKAWENRSKVGPAGEMLVGATRGDRSMLEIVIVGPKGSERILGWF